MTVRLAWSSLLRFGNGGWRLWLAQGHPASKQNQHNSQGSYDTGPVLFWGRNTEKRCSLLGGNNKGSLSGESKYRVGFYQKGKSKQSEDEGACDWGEGDLKAGKVSLKSNCLDKFGPWDRPVIPDRSCLSQSPGELFKAHLLLPSQDSESVD